MEYSTLMEAHKGIVYLFLISLFVKATLSFVNQDLFDKVREKTKVVEMILGTLLIVTGGALIAMHPGGIMSQPWLHAKLTVVILGIPLAIIGLKRNKKILVIIALVLFVYAYLMAKQKSFTLNLVENTTNMEMVDKKA